MTDKVIDINDLRRRVLDGEDVPQEELAAGIARIRQDRAGSSTAKAAKTTKSEAVKKIEGMEDLNDLFK